MSNTKPWVQTDGGFLILLAVMLLLLPLQWVLAAIGAAFFHESCHFLTVRALGGQIYGLRLGFDGAKMEVAPMPPWKETIAALAGPAGSAMLILLAKWLPRMAICGFVHCLFNLLPLFPLDGGRACRGLLRAIWPGERGERVFCVFQRILMWSIGVGCVLAAFRWGIVPAIFGAMVIWRQSRKRIV